MLDRIVQTLRNERMRRGWSQQDVAAHLGVTKTAVRLWEAGQAPAAIRLCAWAALLGHEISAVPAGELPPPVRRPAATPSPLDDLNPFVRNRIRIEPDGCWSWIGACNNTGYGQIAQEGDGRRVSAHRYVWTQLVGAVPPGKVLDHQCHNNSGCTADNECPHRRCVNPDHLIPVEPGENTLSGQGPAARNLRKTHCPKGHEYSHADYRGWRKCRTCRADAAKIRYHANKAVAG